MGVRVGASLDLCSPARPLLTRKGVASSPGYPQQGLVRERRGERGRREEPGTGERGEGKDRAEERRLEPGTGEGEERGGRRRGERERKRGASEAAVRVSVCSSLGIYSDALAHGAHLIEESLCNGDADLVG